MTQDETWLLTEKYNGIPNDAFLHDCTRLQQGEPLAYVIGWVPFLTTRITLATHPLIPRPETEYWTNQAIEEMRTRGDVPLSILDLCAGSGCIGISVLHALPKTHVDFVEIEERHHETIAANLTENTISSSRAHILGGDLFERVTNRYDFILANPPYIDPVLDRTEESVKRYEPSEALYGGDGGLVFIEEILAKVAHFLAPDGVLFLEHEPEQSKRIRECAQHYTLHTETRVDQYGVNRFTRVLL